MGSSSSGDTSRTKPVLRKATLEEPAQHPLHHRAQRVVAAGEALRVDAEKLLDVLADEAVKGRVSNPAVRPVRGGQGRACADGPPEWVLVVTPPPPQVREDMCISCGNCSTYYEMGIDLPRAPGPEREGEKRGGSELRTRESRR